MGMHWDFHGLQQGVLESRYKRFLADVRLPTGEIVVAHCPNTGAMTGCQKPGSRVWMSPSRNPKRKLAWTLELVETAEGMACVHSALANRVVAAALQEKILAPLANFSALRSEVASGGNTRLDFKLEGETVIWVEVKAVSWCSAEGLGLFPDAVSLRAKKHVEELVGLLATGARAALIFCVFHSGVTRVSPAWDVDAAYALALAKAADQGLEVYALGVDISRDGLRATRALTVQGLAGVG